MTRVAAIQMTSAPQVEHNLLRARELLEEAARQQAAIATLPENFAFMGRADSDKRGVAEDDGDGPIQGFLADTAKRLGLWIVGGTLPLRVPGGDGRVAAASLLFDAEGRRVGRYDKIHLFDVDIPERRESYRESAHVTPGARQLVVDTPAGRLGMAVCYDVRFPELFRSMSAEGATWFVLPSAFTAPTGAAHWETLLRARAIENLAYLVAPAQAGRHANGRETYGDSLIVDFWGRVLTRVRSGEACVVAALDAQAQRSAREQFPVLRHRVL